MNATELYESGQLQAAIDRQIQEVKSNPADAPKRMFLFDLLAFAGELDRAKRQIEAILTDEIPEQTAIASYRRLVEAEKLRREVFAGKARPKFLGPVPEHVELRLEALLHLSRNDVDSAVVALDKARPLTPELKGTLEGAPFSMIVDCDDLFGTVLEVLANGDYFWVPMEQIELITLQDPKYPIDLLWRPASMETTNSRGEVFLPSLYPGSHTHTDDQIRLGRLTDWITPETGPVRGVGVHTFLLDDRDASLLEWRELVFEVAATEPAEVEIVPSTEDQS